MAFGGQLTKRQRSKLDTHDGSLEFLELPATSSSRKRHQTEEELALKRSEITRRRKNQSAQRAEQDKLDTINRLLKKQAGKRKKGAQDDDEGGEDTKKNEADNDEATITRNRYMTPTSYLRKPIIPLKEPAYPAARGKCSVTECDQQWKYRGIKSKKVACGLKHLKMIEAGV
ncbi:hypothetical protein BCR41DRAFT_302666 [Lobosporangium transversale]|uniref:INO80 complex subunit B-like conserved region domain-containing protein n=1 Tax=Lobosporangium transversale TaxID=64571 RepID=A0A1Y2GTH2_9FUNG|nr:hypothetical protein BCR41DRAFT_302666 [Lobosporangium transversale]ORZ22817.1 hypothetical protein BCR41DRAFT_302666 [Lobosporangium transversale]|eukprot:XP_021883371.1 hypothetical protein BCR41DRAFT_302666 [Lobosporangium transversale]